MIRIETTDIYLHFPCITGDEADELDEFLEEENVEYEGATDIFINLLKENEQLKNNWDELKKWLEDEHKRNINWYGNLTHHDKQYYLYKFGTTKDVLDNVQDKMQELEGSND